MATTSGIVEKIDRLLEDDEHFTTRTGLRFMTSVLRDALVVIGDVSDGKQMTVTRLDRLEIVIQELLEAQTAKEIHADAERIKWRWALITPTIGIILVEAAKLLLHRP